MKYYLATDLLQRMIKGSDIEKESIKTFLANLIKENHDLYASTLSVTEILSDSILQEDSAVYLNQIGILCNSLLEAGLQRLKVAVGLQKEYRIPMSKAIELSVCIAENIDCIVCVENFWHAQKLITVKSISFGN